MVVINRDWAYWFAIGYYDGRAFGDVQDIPDLPIDDALKSAYKEGYDAGVADYCAYDEDTQTQLENEELEAKKAVIRFVMNTKIEEV